MWVLTERKVDETQGVSTGVGNCDGTGLCGGRMCNGETPIRLGSTGETLQDTQYPVSLFFYWSFQFLCCGAFV